MEAFLEKQNLIFFSIFSWAKVNDFASFLSLFLEHKNGSVAKFNIYPHDPDLHKFLEQILWKNQGLTPST